MPKHINILWLPWFLSVVIPIFVMGVKFYLQMMEIAEKIRCGWENFISNKSKSEVPLLVYKILLMNERDGQPKT